MLYKLMVTTYIIDNISYYDKYVNPSTPFANTNQLPIVPDVPEKQLIIVGIPSNCFWLALCCQIHTKYNYVYFPVVGGWPACTSSRK